MAGPLYLFFFLMNLPFQIFNLSLMFYLQPLLPFLQTVVVGLFFFSLSLTNSSTSFHHSLPILFLPPHNFLKSHFLSISKNCLLKCFPFFSHFLPFHSANFSISILTAYFLFQFPLINSLIFANSLPLSLGSPFHKFIPHFHLYITKKGSEILPAACLNTFTLTSLCF